MSTTRGIIIGTIGKRLISTFLSLILRVISHPFDLKFLDLLIISYDVNTDVTI